MAKEYKQVFSKLAKLNPFCGVVVYLHPQIVFHYSWAVVEIIVMID